MKNNINYDELFECYKTIQSLLDKVGLTLFLKEMPESLQQRLFKVSMKKHQPKDYHEEKTKVW